MAQVSFTVSGLMAVAIAGDSKRRDYWFGHRSRSLFVYISFLILLLPGFISIGGLIPSNGEVPSWIFVTFFFGLLYMMLAVTYFFQKRKLAEPEEFKRLEKRFSKVNSELGFYGLAIFLASIWGWINIYIAATTEYEKAETWLGVVLFFATISGALASVILLRANEETPDTTNSGNAVAILPKNKTFEEQDSRSGFYILISLLFSIIAFMIGLFLRSKDE